MPEITIRCWSQADGAFKEIRWRASEDDESGSGPYPFYTLDDLKLSIYITQRSDRWLPSQVFVGTATDDAASEFLPLDTLWLERGSGGVPNTIILPSPLRTCSQEARPMRRFVEATGEARLVERQDRGRTTLEDAYLIPRNGEMPVFYAFCVSDMIRRFGIAEGQPVPAFDWNGRFRPYFPALTATAYAPNDAANTKVRIDYKRGVRGLLRGIGAAMDQPLVSMQVSGIYALRLLLNVIPVEGFAGCEDFFFRTTVKKQRPFMRLLPAEGTPITKIFIKDATKRPDIADPNLILQWAQELSPYADEDQDYLFAKLYLRSERDTIYPLYATARLFHDSSADVIILPSKQQRVLNPRLDLADLDLKLRDCMSETFLAEFTPTIDETSLELTLNLAREDVPLTRARILERLRVFSYFFQETPNFDKNNVPLIVLKYKAISQFATQNRVFAYISQYFIKVQKGEAKVAEELVNSVMQEFQLTREEATDYARRFAMERDSFVVMAPEVNSFSEENSTGIDIVIYGNHPTYQIQIYRCKTEMTLRRIYMLLSLLLSRDAEIEVNESPEAVAEAEAAAAAAQAAEEEAEASLASAEVPAAAAASSAEESPDIAPAAPPPMKKATALMSAMMGSNSDDSASPVAPPPPPPKKATALMSAMMGSNSDEEEEEEEAPALPPPKKATALMSAMVPSDSEEEEEAAPAPPPPPPTLKVKRVEEAPPPPALKVKRAAEEAEVDVAGALDFPTKLRGYFARQLAKIDPALFVFKAGGDDNSYVRKCQASNGQQPIVLTQSEYDRMMEEYANDVGIKVYFLNFPLTGEKHDVPTDPDIEVITVMRYGSSAESQNYYLCPKYFCHLDRIVLLRSEFEEAGEWRNPDKAGAKPADRCPFCGGSAITDQMETRPGQTVSVRKNKPKTNEIQDYIDFVKPTTHPKGLELPCCYISPKREQIITKSAKLHVKSAAFAHLGAVAPAVAQEAPPVVEEKMPKQYSIALATFPQEYILGETHHPLSMSKFGVVPKCLDAYFDQNSDTLVSRTAIRQVMRQNIKGFFRMGVNLGGSKRDVAEGLFNVLAPYLLKSNVEEVRRLFVERLNHPAFFAAVNHGNLVNEYYKPSLPQDRPTDQELETFSEQINRDYNPALSKPEMLRLYMAFNYFKDNVLSSELATKEYRIFAPILAYPGLITPRGLVIILLEYDSTNTAAPVRVRCPPFGYHSNIYDSADFAFILRDQNGIYEALPFIEHMQVEGLERGRHISHLTFQVAEIPALLPIIARRREEFMRSCKAPMYTVYTGQTGVPANTIMSYSQLVSVEFQQATRGLAKPVAIVRDSYNHIAGCVFEYKYRADKSYLIPFPLADHDGFIPTVEGVPLPFYFDWGAIPDEKLPTVPALVKFYTDVLAAGNCPMYEPVESRRFRDRLVAVKLRNGLLVPVLDSAKTAALPVGEEDDEFEPEWQINREVVFDVKRGEAPAEGPKEIMTRERLEEIYQHFRLSVAQWLNSDEVDGDFIKNLERNILFRHDLPLYERRFRLQLELNDLYSWFAQDDEFDAQEITFYRRNCRKIVDPGACNGTCKWKEVGAGAKGRCAIHIPTEYKMGDESMVDTAKVFVRRVVDELLIFPEKRRQLIENMVKRTGTLTTAIVVAGNQYIIPDSSPRWQELLSLVFTSEYAEQTTIMEEISGDLVEEEEAPCVAAPRSLAIPRPRVRIQRPAAPEAAAPAAEPLGPLIPQGAPAPGPLRIRRAANAAPVPPPLTIRRAAATIRRAPNAVNE